MELEERQKYDNLTNDIIKKIYKVYPFINVHKKFIYSIRGIGIDVKFFYKSEAYGVAQFIPLVELENIKEFEFIENYVVSEIIHKIQEIILKDNEILREIEVCGGDY